MNIPLDRGTFRKNIDIRAGEIKPFPGGGIAGAEEVGAKIV
jgi:hypothetical protein